MKRFKVILLPGDGIGPEVVSEAVRVLKAVEPHLEVRFDLEEQPCGAGEYLRSGDPLPAATVEACRAADATLLGAMGLPDVRWPDGTEMVPQIDIREILDLYAGIRPIYLYHEVHCPLKGYGAGEIDFVIFRENCEGLFASRKNSYPVGALQVEDTLRITRHGAERIIRAAFEWSMKRRKKCTLVDKANVLPTMAYFRSIFDEIAREYPEVTTERVYVDAASLFLLQRPKDFDVLVTENMFGDILSDLAAGLVGGMGMAPSADIGPRHGVFQPSHGTAPSIAGKGIANPVATILSVALMLDWLGVPQGGEMIRQATARVLADPANRTADLGGALSTSGMASKIIEAL